MDRPLALVTGASRGIGAAVAGALADTHRILLGGRDSAALEALAAQLPDARPWVVDLADDAAVADAAAGIDRLDVLVHSAGVAQLADVTHSSADAWRRNYEVNVVAVAELTRLLLPALRAANGHVVVINSGQGLSVREGWGPYAASKFGARAFADVLRAEEEPNGLRVTSVYPGRTDTEMQQAVVAAEGGEYSPAKYLRPESVAGAVAAAVLASPDAHLTDITVRPRPHR
ncbi:short chain dehydrogenase [Saccharomonospora sp. CUA-673]|uniref:SDR family oxidoreductase n=1 Tax=Saccharomonospora sp. CUA-673 TaxID=1904969 RepID=UPI00095A898A|nr:SDR family oxidoreductase [Saccharomonospora sp. CUA-673]OLT45489.1 short chain dehydrogenase [Saccharomonospora sp. CUA-673]